MRKWELVSGQDKRTTGVTFGVYVTYIGYVKPDSSQHNVVGEDENNVQGRLPAAIRQTQRSTKLTTLTLFVFTNCWRRLDTFSTSQNKPTPQDTHWTVDLVITRSETEISGIRTGSMISDHALVCFTLCTKKLRVEAEWVTRRAWRRLSRVTVSPCWLQGPAFRFCHATTRQPMACLATGSNIRTVRDGDGFGACSCR